MSNTIYRPAIRSGMGIWNYYISTLTYDQIAEYVKMPDEIYQSEKLSDMLQRVLTDNAKAIYEYLVKEDERFFNSLVLAVYGGSPKWHEGVFEMKEETFSNIGVLELTGKEKIFPIDGQHRVSAIKELVEKNGGNDKEEVPVIYIAHMNDDKGIRRTRKLFTTLNRYAKPVKTNEIIALDEDDISAIVTRRMVEEGGIFEGNRLVFSKTESIGKSDKTSFTHIITLYKCNCYILKGFLIENGIKTRLSDFLRYRPSDEIIDSFECYLNSFWRNLINDEKALFDYMNISADASSYRNEGGGNLLFRPAGLKAYVESIVDIHMKSGKDYKDIILKMSSLNLDLNVSPWQGVLWNNGKMIMNNKELVKNLFIYNFDCGLTDKKNKTIIDKEKMVKAYKALISFVGDEEELEKMITQQ